MKSVLFVDPIYQPGHANFNEIYLRELHKYTSDISVVFTKDYPIDSSLWMKCPYMIPQSCTKKRGSLLTRVYYFYTLLKIRYHVRLSKYDIVIFSSYEEISFYFSGIKSTYVINHVNLQGISNKFKSFFLKRVFKRNIPIVFESRMKEELYNRYKIPKIILSPHGLVKKQQFNLSHLNDILSIFLSRDNYDSILFCPSDNSTDFNFVKKCIFSNDFIRFLYENKILLVLRSKEIAVECKNIMIIREYLSSDSYKSLFILSKAILIIYPPSFKNRVSGVLYECFAYQKRCILNNIEAFLSYKSFFQYNPFFYTSEELIQRVKESILSDKNEELFTNLDKLNPNIEDLFLL